MKKGGTIMNRASEEWGGDRRQAIQPGISVYLLMGIGSRLQTRTRAAGLTTRRRGQAALATVLVFVAVVLASPAAFAQAGTTTPVAAPATGQLASQQAAAKPTECELTTSGSWLECLFNDSRLGPTQLPTTGPEGSVTLAIAKMTRGYHPFGPGKTDETAANNFIKKYWDKNARAGKGDWKYPDNDGFVGKPSRLTLKPNPNGSPTFVDRFGKLTGFFLAPDGASFAARALPPASLDTYDALLGGITYHYNYHVYKVVKAFEVDAGQITPWFNQKGEGEQYRTCLFLTTDTQDCTKNVQYLVDHDYLQEQAWPK
jgi:Tuberculosis necrotizing toxin